LKQLQLIQILHINAESAVTSQVVAAKVPDVNRTRQRPNASKTASGDADTAFALANRVIARVLRFTAR
jgi:hypothetical protein